MKWPKYTLILILGLFVQSALANKNPEVYEERETISRSFPASQESYLEVENKYGDIEIITWDKDSIQIDVELIFESEDNSDFERMRELFEINFEHNANFTLAQTAWQDEASFFRKGVIAINNTLGGKRKLQINYKIHAPNYLEIELENKFGNIFMGDFDGELEVKLSYGDFRARKLTNSKNIEVSYGKVKIKNVSQGRLDFSSVKSADIEKLEDVILKSSSSEIEVEEAYKVNLNSKHDEIVFEKIEELSGDMTLTDLEIDVITKRIGLNSKYGSVRIKEIDASSEKINLEGNRTDFRIGFSTFFNGDIQVAVSDEEDFMFAEKFQLESRGVDDKGFWKGIGFLGEKGQTQVSIISENGVVEFD